MTAYLWGIAGVFAGIVLPGLAVAALLDRRRDPAAMTPERFAGLALASGLSIWVLATRVLDRLGWLSGGPVATVLLVLVFGSGIVLVGPGRPTLHALVRRDTAKFAGWALGSTLVGAAPLVRVVFDDRATLIGSTPWYYWSLVRQTVASGGTPGRTWEWGRFLPFLDDYPGFTPAIAVFAMHGKSTSLAAAHIVEVLAMLSSGLAVFLLVRALHGSRYGAALATLLFFAADVFANKMIALRPEAMGYAFALLVPVVALEYVRTRERLLLGVLVAVFASLGLVHGIDWLFGGALLTGALTCTFPGRTAVRQWLAGVVPVAVVAAAAWVLAGVLLGGNLSGASSLGELPVVRHGVDPTWRFAALVQGAPSPDPPSIGNLVTTSLDRGLRGMGSPWLLALVTVATVILLLRAFAGSSDEDRSVARRALVFLVVTGAVTLAIAAVFAIGWTTYVPRRTGFARLAQIALLLVPIATGIAVSGFRRRASRGAERVLLATGGAALLFVAFVFVHGEARLDDQAAQHPRADTLGALRTLPIGPRDVVLTNGYSEGLVPVVTGGRAVLQGRAPYTDAPLLTRANGLLTRTVQLFARPRDATSVLPCTGITYVLVSTDGGRTLGMPAAFPADLNGLDARSDLAVAASGPGFKLYRVRTDVAAVAASTRCHVAS